jgi:GTP-binding protein
VDGPGPSAAPSETTLEQVADLTAPNDEFILCHGGKGGKGNVHFKSSRNRAPRQYSEGEEGEEGEFLLELRTMADAGPGRISERRQIDFAAPISAAHPKVAAYPFHDLAPDDRSGGFRRLPARNRGRHSGSD